MRLIEKLSGADGDGNSSLASLADLMSALMLIFLMIAVALLQTAHDAEEKKAEMEAQLTEAQEERDLYKPVFERFESVQTTRRELAAHLQSRISQDDLARWRAEFNPDTLSIRFNDPDYLFETGSAALSPAFKRILEEFAPTLLDALAEDDMYHQVASLRIEGHTSSEWSADTRVSPRLAHIRNMNLSQGRAFAVVEYLASMESTAHHWDEWTRQRIEALGLGPNRLILDDDGSELPRRSRRVEVWIEAAEVSRNALGEWETLTIDENP